MRVREQQPRRRRYAYVQPHNDRRETSTGEDEDEGDMAGAQGGGCAEANVYGDGDGMYAGRMRGCGRKGRMEGETLGGG